MRKRVKKHGLSVHAIAGTYVVLLGMDVDANSSLLDGLLGFAIHRTDHSSKNTAGSWLKGYLTFESSRKAGDQFGKLVSSQENPIQEFLWGDYTVRANRKYTYRVVPMYGEPTALKRRAAEVSVTISTESESETTHAVYFNRGVAGSQAYARQFQNKAPDKVANRAAFKWLSRGLEEALISFIGKATDEHWSLRAAVYEFQHGPVLEAFKEAHLKDANIRIIFDYRMGTNKPARKNWNAIKQAGIADLVIKRKQNKSYISHNKFIVLLKDGQPMEVWTGSTNITEGGIFGHSNVGHIVRGADVAKAYYDYWQQLSTDPPAKDFRKWNDENTPVPRSAKRAGIHTVFSPRSTLEALEYYTSILDEAKSSVFLTAAFGVNKLFQEILKRDKPYLRYLLLETEDSNIRVIKRNLNNQIAVGQLIGDEEGAVEGWLKQVYRGEKLAGLNEHVKYIHTKYLLIDPLSKTPILITGSANFSNPSTTNNDENMLIIRGDTRVVDIYLGEFMRLFSHFKRRGMAAAANTAKEEQQFLYLCPDDSWAAPFYESGSAKMKERLLFS